jgi:O-antigen/teichoic acid export membrane protein
MAGEASRKDVFQVSHDYFNTLLLRMRIKTALLSHYGYMAVLAGSNFILIPILLSALGPKDYGFYTMLYSIAHFSAIGVGWMGGVAMRLIGVYEIRHEVENIQKINTIQMMYFFVYGLIIVLLSWLASFFFSDAPSLSTAIQIVGIFLFCNYLVQALFNLLFALNYQISANVLRSLQVLLTILFTILLFKKTVSLSIPFVAMLMAALLSLVITFLFSRSFLHFSSLKNLDRKMVTEVFFEHGLWVFLYGVFFLMLFLDAAFLGFLGTPELAGMYTILWQIPNFLALFLWKISETLSPYYVRMDAEGNHQKLSRFFIKNLLIVASLGGLLGLGFFFFGNPLLKLWVGENAFLFQDRLPQGIFFITSLAFFLSAVERVFSVLLFSLGRFKAVTGVLALQVAGKFLLAYFFFPSFGVASTLLGYSTITLLFSLWAYLALLLSHLREKTHSPTPILQPLEP